ncbi:MAG: septal ring lytic transglycosylase RlpA family protein [Candidatus Solibacter usitatus]|nr:septal ring lytic transglycosylase RlpA family protein [Candidatus Solibacter usitatus]
MGISRKLLMSAAVALTFFALGCGSKKHARISAPRAPHSSAASRSARTTPPAKPAPVVPRSGELEGKASWYGNPYHGRKTANGEIYDMYKLTAAHRTLPFGTILRVTNLSNRRVVDVRINDRGPYVNGVILDLSLGAAQRLDMVRVGVTRVHLSIIPRSASTLGAAAP